MSTSVLALTGKLLLPYRTLTRGTVECADGKIIRVSKGRPSREANVVIDAGDGYIAPGFIDIHVHGGSGADYMDGTPDAVRTANRAHLRHGTTTVFPTTTTGTPEELHAMIAACKSVAAKWKPDDGAHIAGIHLYGPYFAENKVGCHPPEGRREPTRTEYEEYFATGMIKIATCAAELPGAEAFYKAARKRKCLITCGHSDASWPEMEAAFEAGMRHVDHFWCAMSSVPSVRARLGTPMRGSMEQFVIAHAEMSTEVIADGMHLAPELLEYAYRWKGPSKLALVTDSNRAMDMPPGRYRFGHHETGSWFESNGAVGYVPGQGLASSVIGLDGAIRVMARDTTAPLHEIVRMASLTPAQLTGIDKTAGSLEEGKRADVVILDKDLNVRRVFLGGKSAY